VGGRRGASRPRLSRGRALLRAQGAVHARQFRPALRACARRIDARGHIWWGGRACRARRRAGRRGLW
jgi:hypothetical protein